MLEEPGYAVWWDRALQNVRSAMDRGGRLLVIERLLPGRGEPSPTGMIDVTMLAITGGNERTESEYRALLASSGFEVASVAARWDACINPAHVELFGEADWTNSRVGGLAVCCLWPHRDVVMPAPEVITRLWNTLRWVKSSGDVELDQRRRFLAKVLTVALSLCGPVGLGLLPLALNPDAPTSTQAFGASAALTVVMLVCYLTNRWSARLWGAFLFISACMDSTLWSALEEPFVLAFMSIEMLLALAVLELRHAVMLSALGLCGHALLLVGPVTLRGLALPAVFNLTFLVMGLTTQWHYRDWERRRLSQVRQSQQWFKTTLSSIGDAVLAVDPDRHLTFMNTVAEQLTGWTTAAAVGKPIDQVFEIVHESSGLAAPNLVDAVLREKKVVGSRPPVLLGQMALPLA